MSQISVSNLQHIVDKMARHAAESNGDQLASAIATGATYTWASFTGGLAVADYDVLSLLQTLVTGFTDADQQSDFVPPVDALNTFSPLLNAFLYSFWSGVRKGLDSHMSRYAGNAMVVGDLTPLDAALRVLNATTLTLRLHGAFGQYFGGISPNNLFTPKPFVLATLTLTGATAGTFTHVSSISGQYGPGQIALMNVKANTTAATIAFTGTQGGVGIPISITAGATTNYYITPATDISQTFTDAPALTSISGGTSGDLYDIIILPDRCINAA
jgi:hypothetical protein